MVAVSYIRIRLIFMIIGNRIGIGGYSEIYRCVWNGTHVAGKLSIVDLRPAVDGQFVYLVPFLCFLF